MLRILLLLTLAGRALAGDIAITVQSSAVPDGELPLSWQSDNPTYTVRILVNKSQVDEIKSLSSSSYVWTAQNTKVGDTLQFWVYDSAGNAGKTAFLLVVDKLPQNAGFDLTYSSGDGTGSVGLEASKTISEAGSFETKNAGGGNWSSLENGTDHALSSATATGSSAILSASILPSGVSDTLADPLESATSSESSSTPTPSSSSVSVSDSSTSSTTTEDDSSTDSSSSSSMALYIGIGLVVLSIIIGVAFYLWWRQHKKTPDPNASKDPNEVEKQRGNYTQPGGEEDESWSEDEGTQKKDKGKSYSMGKGRRSSRRSRSSRNERSSSSDGSGSSEGSENSSSAGDRRGSRRRRNSRR